MNYASLFFGIFLCLWGVAMIFIGPDWGKMIAPTLIIPGGALIGLSFCKKCESDTPEKKPKEPEKKPEEPEKKSK